MEILFLLIPISIALGACFLGMYLQAARSGQFEDLDTPAKKILLIDNKYKKKSARRK